MYNVNFFSTNVSLFWAIWSLGITNLNTDWHYFTISISLVLNDFVNSLFITKSREQR